MLKTAQEDVLRVFKESEDFHEEAMAHAAYMLGPSCISGSRKEMFKLLKARDATFSQTGWGLLDPATPDDTQRAKSVALNTSVDTLGDIPMNSAYLESAANVDSVTAMDRAAVPTLTEVG
nr:hypothetical protein Itr_chr11CG18850 [Ipomoea trifida]